MIHIDVCACVYIYITYILVIRGWPRGRTWALDTHKKLSFLMYWLYFPWKNMSQLGWVTKFSAELQIYHGLPLIFWWELERWIRSDSMSSSVNLLENVGKPTGEHDIPNTQRAQPCSALNPAGSWSHGKSCWEFKGDMSWVNTCQHASSEVSLRTAFRIFSGSYGRQLESLVNNSTCISDTISRHTPVVWPRFHLKSASHGAAAATIWWFAVVHGFEIDANQPGTDQPGSLNLQLIL